MNLNKLRFHPLFVSELEECIAYYLNQSPIVAKKFKAEIKKQLTLIKRNPRIRTVRYDNIRFARIESFPYSIHYSIDAANQSILITL